MWNTKIKCKKVYKNLDVHNFEVGDDYEVINGRLILPNGEESCRVYDTIEHLNECFYAVFEEVEN